MAVLFVVQWRAVQRIPMTRSGLEAVDTSATTLIGTLVALVGVTSPVGNMGALHSALCVSALLSLRAILIPSSLRRTLFISATAASAALAAIVLLLVRASQHPSPITQIPPIPMGLLAGMWMFGFAAVATLASRVIYGLRQEVKAARQIGQYVLSEKLGEGGMGVVYRATHAMLRRETAIKLLPPERVGRDALGRFEREVRMTARLTHPNTVSVYDYGTTPDGSFYYAMEYLEGLDLDVLVAAVGALPAGRVVHLLAQVCASLTEAHETGLIHRDIKPSNIVVTERGGIPDVVKVLDFGLVKDLEGTEEAEVTMDQNARGTPLYMSPEAIATPADVGPASDLYAVAAVGYFLLTGSHVFSGRTLMAVCASHLYDEPEPPSRRLRSAVPEGLERLLLCGLAKNPALRPSSARAFRGALLQLRDRGEVARWTEDEASAWWTTLGRGLVRKATGPRTGGAPFATTIAVDVTAR